MTLRVNPLSFPLLKESHSECQPFTLCSLQSLAPKRGVYQGPFEHQKYLDILSLSGLSEF